MTTLNKIDVDEDGTLFLRFLKNDGGWHRTSIPITVDADAQMNAVDNHLQAMGQSRVTGIDRAAIRTRAASERAKPRLKQLFEDIP